MPAARLIPTPRCLERTRDLFVGTETRQCLMPDPAVGVLVAGERRRQRTVCGSALAVRGGLEQRGTHERMAELERAVGDAKQALPLGGVERILGQAGLARSPHHGGDLLPVIQRRDQ